jgi:hypothetical protein
MIVLPVMQAVSSEARKRAALATSAGSPTRPRGYQSASSSKMVGRRSTREAELQVARSIIAARGGDLELRSEPDHGTRSRSVCRSLRRRTSPMNRMLVEDDERILEFIPAA